MSHQGHFRKPGKGQPPPQRQTQGQQHQQGFHNNAFASGNIRSMPTAGGDAHGTTQGWDQQGSFTNMSQAYEEGYSIPTSKFNTERFGELTVGTAAATGMSSSSASLRTGPTGGMMTMMSASGTGARPPGTGTMGPNSSGMDTTGLRPDDDGLDFPEDFDLPEDFDMGEDELGVKDEDVLLGGELGGGQGDAGTGMALDSTEAPTRLLPESIQNLPGNHHQNHPQREYVDPDRIAALERERAAAQEAKVAASLYKQKVDELEAILKEKEELLLKRTGEAGTLKQKLNDATAQLDAEKQKLAKTEREHRIKEETMETQHRKALENANVSHQFDVSNLLIASGSRAVSTTKAAPTRQATPSLSSSQFPKSSQISKSFGSSGNGIPSSQMNMKPIKKPDDEFSIFNFAVPSKSPRKPRTVGLNNAMLEKPKPLTFASDTAATPVLTIANVGAVDIPGRSPEERIRNKLLGGKRYSLGMRLLMEIKSDEGRDKPLRGSEAWVQDLKLEHLRMDCLKSLTDLTLAVHKTTIRSARESVTKLLTFSLILQKKLHTVCALKILRKLFTSFESVASHVCRGSVPFLDYVHNNPFEVTLSEQAFPSALACIYFLFLNQVAKAQARYPGGELATQATPPFPSLYSNHPKATSAGVSTAAGSRTSSSGSATFRGVSSNAPSNSGSTSSTLTESLLRQQHQLSNNNYNRNANTTSTTFTPFTAASWGVEDAGPPLPSQEAVDDQLEWDLFLLVQEVAKYQIEIRMHTQQIHLFHWRVFEHVLTLNAEAFATARKEKRQDWQGRLRTQREQDPRGTNGSKATVDPSSLSSSRVDIDADLREGGNPSLEVGEKEEEEVSKVYEPTLLMMSRTMERSLWRIDRTLGVIKVLVREKECGRMLCGYSLRERGFRDQDRATTFESVDILADLVMGLECEMVVEMANGLIPEIKIKIMEILTDVFEVDAIQTQKLVRKSKLLKRITIAIQDHIDLAEKIVESNLAAMAFVVVNNRGLNKLGSLATGFGAFSGASTQGNGNGGPSRAGSSAGGRGRGNNGSPSSVDMFSAFGGSTPNKAVVTPLPLAGSGFSGGGQEGQITTLAYTSHIFPPLFYTGRCGSNPFPSGVFSHRPMALDGYSPTGVSINASRGMSFVGQSATASTSSLSLPIPPPGARSSPRLARLMMTMSSDSASSGGGDQHNGNHTNSDGVFGHSGAGGGYSEGMGYERVLWLMMEWVDRVFRTMPDHFFSSTGTGMMTPMKEEGDSLSLNDGAVGAVFDRHELDGLAFAVSKVASLDLGLPVAAQDLAREMLEWIVDEEEGAFLDVFSS